MQRMLAAAAGLAPVWCISCLLALGALPAAAQVEAEAAAEAQAVYPVSRIQLETPPELAEILSLQELEALPVSLGEDPDRWTVPSVNRPTRVVRIAEIGRQGTVALDRSAIIEICATIVRALQAGGHVARCQPDPGDIQHGDDLRGERSELRLQVMLARVRNLRTFASGDRRLADGAGPTNNPTHQRIREGAPVALAVADADAPPPLLEVDRLEEYVARLSRHPGRTVGLVYSRASARDAGLTVDLVVTEAKPWTTYFQTTDTGTENTGEYRNRVGFSHTQLTGNDDILQLEYLTSDFDEVQAASGSYEAPIPGLDMARFKLFGAMSRFDNDDLGIFSGDFQGTRSEVGLRMLGNVFQRRSLFVDLSLGLRAESLSVDNGILRVKARDHFVLPSLGLRFERRTPFSGFAGGLELEGNLAGLAGTDTEELNAFGLPDRAGGLGRTDADAHFGILRFDFAGSLFLEPLLSGSADSLANELSLRAGGQHALEDRLVPQEQAIAGGRDTVRGYEQAVAVGDSVYLASLEYRYHFPRALAPRRAQPLPLWLRWAQLGSDRFRLAPEQPSGPTDWDLVLKTFLDFARVLQSDRLSFESHETLLGAGIGVELRLRQNFTLALDLGFPLEEGHLLGVDRGDPVLHFSLTALY